MTQLRQRSARDGQRGHEAQPVDLPGAPPRLEGLVARPFDPDTDLPALADLMDAVNRHDDAPWMPTEEELRHRLSTSSGQDPRADILVAEVGSQLVGEIEVKWRVRAGRVFHHIELWVRPDARRNGLGRALLGWMEGHILEGIEAGSMGPQELPHVFALWSDLAVAASGPFAAAAGYEVVGYGVIMTRSLLDPIPDLPLPDGLELRPVKPEDHRRIWDADVEAFRDHRDPADRTQEDYLSWFTQPDIDTSLWDVAWDGDEVAGSVQTFIFPKQNATLGVAHGWLEHISVRRAWRRRGLASALITRAMLRLRDLGMTDALLGADAENLTGAVRVYEALGFRRSRTAANYHKPAAGRGRVKDGAER